MLGGGCALWTAVPSVVSSTCCIAVCMHCSFKLKMDTHKPASGSGRAVRKRRLSGKFSTWSWKRTAVHSLTTRRSCVIGSTGGNETGDRTGVGSQQFNERWVIKQFLKISLITSAISRSKKKRCWQVQKDPSYLWLQRHLLRTNSN